MVDSYVVIPPDSTGKRIRTTQAIVEGVPVQEQVMQIADLSNTIIDPAKESSLIEVKTQQIDGTQQAKVKETAPTDTTKTNGSFVYTYDGSGNLTQIDQAIGAVTYRKTLTYDGSGNLTGMSVWTVV